MLAATLNRDPIKTNSVPRVKGIGWGSQPFSVFLVDDDTMFLKSLEHHLQHHLSHRVKITPFLSGEECIKNFYQKPDVIILDYNLDGHYPKAMNGVTVLKTIKQSNPDMITIMVSGQDKIQVAIDTMKYGAYDYIIKDENAFLRVQNSVKNAIHNILLTRELKSYKFRMKVVMVIIAIAFFGAIIQIFFPQYFHLGK